MINCFLWLTAFVWAVLSRDEDEEEERLDNIHLTALDATNSTGRLL